MMSFLSFCLFYLASEGCNCVIGGVIGGGALRTKQTFGELNIVDRNAFLIFVLSGLKLFLCRSNPLVDFGILLAQLCPFRM